METEQNTTYKVVYHAHGFDPEKDLTPIEWEMAKAQYVQMYNMFCQGTNQGLPKINSTWQKYQDVKESGDILTTFQFEQVMGILDHSGMTYEDWVEKWYLEYAHAVDMGVGLMTRLWSDIYRDGDYVGYGVKFKDHPEWKITFTLEKV